MRKRRNVVDITDLEFRQMVPGATGAASSCKSFHMSS